MRKDSKTEHRTNTTPSTTRHRVNRLIAEGKFTDNKVKKEQLKIIYRALHEKDPKGYYEITDYYVLYYDGHKLTTYSV